MAVTEFGIIKGSAPSLAPKLLRALEAALAAQVKWLDLAVPQGTSVITGGRAWLFQQLEDPGMVLLAARWKTIEEHSTWACEEPNRESILSSIGQHLYQPPDDAGKGTGQKVPQAVVVVHTESDIFQDARLLDSPVISITRTFIKAGQREAFQSTFDKVGVYLQTYEDICGVQTGWRIDRAKDEQGADKDEFVVVCGWPNLEAHMGFGLSPHIDEINTLEQYIDGRDVRHYQRIL